MGKDGYTYLDESFLSYRKNSAINLMGAGIGFKEDYKEYGERKSRLVLYKSWAIAVRGPIRKRERDICGMMVSDGLVKLAQEPDLVLPKIYYMCREIGKFTYPYLYNHDWREENKYDRKLRRKLADRVVLIDKSINKIPKLKHFYKYCGIKQSVGDMVLEKLEETSIPNFIVRNMRPFDVVNLETFDFLESQSKPPDWWEPVQEKIMSSKHIY